LKTATQWIGLALKLGARYYVAGVTVTIFGLMHSYHPHADINLGFFWLVVPLFEPYYSIVSFIIEGRSPHMEGGWGFVAFAALIFAACFYLTFRLLSRISRQA